MTSFVNRVIDSVRKAAPDTYERWIAHIIHATLDEAALLCRRRAEGWGASTMRHEAEHCAEAIAALKKEASP